MFKRILTILIVIVAGFCSALLIVHYSATAAQVMTPTPTLTVTVAATATITQTQTVNPAVTPTSSPALDASPSPPFVALPTLEITPVVTSTSYVNNLTPAATRMVSPTTTLMPFPTISLIYPSAVPAPMVDRAPDGLQRRIESLVRVLPLTALVFVWVGLVAWFVVVQRRLR